MRHTDIHGFISLCAFVVLALGLATPAGAQTTDDVVIVKVPFDFVAGDQELPAGTYRVEVLPGTEQHDPGLVTLQTAAKAEQPSSMVFQSVSTDSVEVNDTTITEEARLVFSKVGGLYFLEEVNAP